MYTFRDIIDHWPTTASFAADLGISGSLARQWKHRDNIPAPYWRRLIAVVAHRDISDVTLALLARLAEQRNET